MFSVKNRVAVRVHVSFCEGQVKYKHIYKYGDRAWRAQQYLSHDDVPVNSKSSFFSHQTTGGRRILYYFGFEIDSKEPEGLSKCAQNSIVRFRAYMKSKFLFDGE